MTTISRDRATGKLLLNGTPTILRGGAYDLFFDPGRSPEAIVKAGTGTVHNVVYPRGQNPCQTSADKQTVAELATWSEAGGAFGEFFAAMKQHRCNFLRVFLHGATLLRGGKPVTLTPFVRLPTTDGSTKYDVRGAVVDGNWNVAYFNRLRAFAAAADAAGVVVQLSLFNYYDLVPQGSGSVKTWSHSAYNAANCPNPVWAANHLIPNATSGADRQRLFVTPQNSLRVVQEKVIARTMEAVAGLGNVVLEPMNEPHGIHTAADLARVAEFSSAMTGFILKHRQRLGSHALVSVNASFDFPADGTPPGESDVQVWQRQGLPHHGEVDVVSYHGMTAMGWNGSYAGCSGNVRAPRVDAGAVQVRYQRHRQAHPDKALVYCTDAVFILQFGHVYNEDANDGRETLDMQVRDGQVLPQQKDDTLPEQLLRGRVINWAARCFAQGDGAETGRAHFQNHSTFRRQLEQIGRAAANIGVAAPAPEEDLALV